MKHKTCDTIITIPRSKLAKLDMLDEILEKLKVLQTTIDNLQK